MILLGMKIDRNDKKKTISLSQTHYIDSLLEHFGLANVNMVSTPIDLHHEKERTTVRASPPSNVTEGWRHITRPFNDMKDL